jgi:hypothetical protein
MDQLRHTSMKQVTYNNNLTLKYVNRKESKFARAVVGSNAVWEDLLKKDADGKRSPDLKFLNPYTETSEFVDPEDIEFLKEILWEINKYLLPGLKDEERSWRYKEHEKEILELHSVKEWMETSRYFNVPLRKASDFDRARGARHNGIVKTVSQWWDSVWDEIDPRQLHATARAQVASTYGSDATLMYNQYDLSPIHRAELLEKEGVYSFEIDLSILASDVAFQHYREILFNDVLLTADAVATVMHFVQ